MERHVQRFRPVPVSDIESAVALAFSLSDAGSDTYFACAEYNSSDSRTAANASCACGLWLDIDCSPEKAAAGKGYADTEEARDEVLKFCEYVDIPAPTFVVYSGGGLHVYWVFDQAIQRDAWIHCASKLKALAKKRGLLADPSRTADIASVLRIPGTLNHKYDPPRPVRLVTVAEHRIERNKFLQSIAIAHEILLDPPRTPEPEPGGAAGDKGVTRTDGTPSYGSLDLVNLAAALKCLDPDCDDETWKLGRLAPMARAASEQPEMAAKLKALARSWSSGELHGAPCKAWTTPGASNGVTGEVEFDRAWSRFLRGDYSGRPTTLGTIYHDAEQAGWRDLEAFQAVDAAAPIDARQHAIERSEETVKALLARVKGGDIGTPLEPDNVAALALLEKGNPAEFQRVRGRLKTANKRVSLTAIDSAVKQERAERDVAPTHHGYATDLIARLTVDGWPPVGHEGDLYVVDRETSIWIAKEHGQLARQVAEIHDNGDNCKRIGDYKGIAEYATSYASDDSFFEEAPVGLACPDGFYQIVDKDVRVVPLTPAHRQRVLVSYSPREQATPLFDTFLHETFQSEREGEEAEQVALLQELAGAIMFGLMHRYHKAFLFYEPYGRAGKGTLVHILTALVPREFVTAISPMQWDKEYYTVHLVGSRLNVVGELPDDKSIPAAQFKSVTGGDLITGRHPACRPISFKNQAAHLFNANHLINSHDQSEAFFTRWSIVDFPNSRLRSGLPLDPTLADRIVEQELPGIAHWAMQGATRLLRNNGFSKSAAHDRLMQKWRRCNSSLEEFIDECCALGSDHHVRRSDLFTHYKYWCGENGRKNFGKSRVKDLLEHNIGLGITWAILDGYEIFRGVKLKIDDGDDQDFLSTKIF